MYDKFGLFIDNEWRAAKSDATVDVIDPTNEEHLGAVPRAGAADLDEALATLARGGQVWGATSGWERSAVLRRIVGELDRRREAVAVAMPTETGKPIAEARGEVGAAIDQFDWYADEARRIFGHTLDGRDAGPTGCRCAISR